MMQTGLARYGFSRNPFRVEVDPLVDPTHCEWIVRVDGFSRLDEIDNHLIKTCRNPQPLFFLVTGKSGTGRTSVANYILARYRDHRGISKDRFVVPEDRWVRSHDEYTTFKNWLIYLIDNVDELSPIIDLPPNLLTTINSAERDTMEAVFQGVVRRISNRMASASPPTGFGCCLEDIPSYRFISAAFSIFGKAHAVCVFTAGDYEEWQREVIQPFKKATANYPESIVELSPLTGEQVRSIVSERWDTASRYDNPENVSQHASPFDPDGVENAFGHKVRPIGKVLSIIARMLELKAPVFERGPSWPDADHLRFSAEELRENLRILEES